MITAKHAESATRFGAKRLAHQSSSVFGVRRSALS